MPAAPHICFDRYLPGDLTGALAASDPQLEAIIPIGKAWPNGSSLRFLGGTQAQRARHRAGPLVGGACQPQLRPER